jgi:D-beta-D-heptose 7-phosphate kinase/D-beta-D-heptose 1-phosphate adenosyltransferase
LVIGDIMCDVYLCGAVRRVSPEAPVPVFESAEQYHVLGGAGNVAANLRALGCTVHILSVVGADAAGQEVRQLLRRQGIADTWLVEDATRPTTAKTRLIAHQQQVLRLDQESRAPLESALHTRVLERAQSLLQEVDGIVCSDYHKGVCTPDVLGPLFAQARAAECPIIVDPKVNDFTLYRGATVLTPNLVEAEHATGMTLEDEADLEKAAITLYQQSQAQALLVTRGKDGMSLLQPARAPLHIPANTRKVFDVTGAGDTVIAAFSMAVLCGLSFAEAAHLANTAAGVVVGKLGTAVISLEELRLALRQQEVPEAQKVLSRDELVQVVQKRRQRGEHIVFTNGCFDLFHVGHMRYLQQARSLGECLIVALNDDASVHRLKGEGRPLIPQQERAQLLAALGYIDYVTIFSEDTPLELVELLRPDVLVKGGDYMPETVVGRDVVELYGGTVAILPSIDGVSTTNIIERIVERYGRVE